MTAAIALRRDPGGATQDVTAEARAAWRRARAEVAAAAFLPKSRLSLSQWSDAKRHLSDDLGEPGPWRTDRVPYLRRPMDAITDPRVRRVTVMKSARIGATQGLVLNTIGFYVDQEPSPIIVGLPTIDDAVKFSQQLLQPMFDDTPCLAGRLEALRAQRKRQTMLQKTFPGGTVQMVGTKSPRAMRMVHGRIILKSEIDAYEFSAGMDGDPSALLDKRAMGYGAPKFVEESTPLIKALSRIEPAFLAGSEEYYHVPCPHCREYQRLVWGARTTHFGLRWENHDPSTAHYVCEPNGCVIQEREKPRMVARGDWHAMHPERTEHLSFHLNALVSPFPGARWPLLVDEWLTAQRKPEKLRVFVNTVLGETYKDDGDELDPGVLAERLEPYPCRCPGGAPRHDDAICPGLLVPAGVGLLTRTIDTQDDRVETLVVGFGAGEEAWIIDHVIIPGDPGTEAPWRALALELPRTYPREQGGELAPRVTFVDSGGHHTKAVYKFARTHSRRRVFAIKGMSEPGAPLLGRPSKRSADRTLFYPVGSFTGKEAVAARLAKVRNPGPGYIHLPSWLDGEQLAQLTNETLVTKTIHGRPKRVWIQRGRTELFHLMVYALAALQQLGPAVLARLERPAKPAPTPEAPAPDTPTVKLPPDVVPPEPPKRKRAPRKSSWVGGWR